jgi:hypothetical protein
VVGRHSENYIATDVVESICGGRRLQAFKDYDSAQASIWGTHHDAGTASTGAPNPRMGNRSSTVLGRMLARRPRIPVVLDLHRRTAEIVNDTEVIFHGIGGKEDGTEEEDGGWKSVGGCGDRVLPDPAIDLRPIGVKSKF